MIIDIVCDKTTRDKLYAVYGKKPERNFIKRIIKELFGNNELVIIAGVDDTLYLDFIAEGEGITGDLPTILDRVSREYWKRHQEERYIKDTLYLKDDFPCFGNYNGFKTCNDCLLWRECAEDG